MVKCEVLGCPSKLGIEGITLHHFPPNDSPQFLEWHQKCGYESDQKTMSSNRRLCSLHFRPDDYKTTLKSRRLLESAVPSVAINSRPEYEVGISFNPRTSNTMYLINVGGLMLSLKLKIDNETTPRTVLTAEKVGSNVPVISISTMNQVVNHPNPPPTKLRKLEDRLIRVLNEKNHYQKRSTLNREAKNSLKAMHQMKISRKRAQQNLRYCNLVSAHKKKVKNVTEQSEKYL